jgi:hypothetical protein
MPTRKGTLTLAGKRRGSAEAPMTVPSYMTFYTTGDKVEFSSQARFEGKSNYLNYVTTDKLVEQKLEKMWLERTNKKI